MRRTPAEFYRLLPGRKCWPWTPSPTPPTASWPSWERAGQAEGRHHPEHRRPAPEGRQPGGAGAPRQRAAEPLYPLREILRCWSASRTAAAFPAAPAAASSSRTWCCMRSRLDEDVMARAIHYIRQADVLIIGGTSLVVYPAAGLIQLLPRP